MGRSLHGAVESASVYGAVEGTVRWDRANPHATESVLVGGPWVGDQPTVCSHTTKGGKPCKGKPLGDTTACVAHSRKVV